MIRISHYPIMSGEVEFVSSEFDICKKADTVGNPRDRCGPH